MPFAASAHGRKWHKAADPGRSQSGRCRGHNGHATGKSHKPHYGMPFKVIAKLKTALGASLDSFTSKFQ
jgi:hypothetical protein